ncbi:MAG: heparinase II/III family protein, partial [Burkholderiales bacterium]|nr:heparinase II/III family protein [Opitutaceae bacterium]
ASADYLTQVTAPSGRYFNYADAREFVPPRPVLHWFAQKRSQPQIAAPELLRLAGKAAPIEGELQGIYERHDALAFWWRGTDMADCRATPSKLVCASGDRPSAPAPLAWLGHGENPVAVFRSAWDDPRATYLAIKGGSPATSHAHMDAGSFILEADGVRWADDPGMQDYHTLESAGVNLWDGKQTGARWDIFRLGPEAHNILRFNSAPQLVAGAATFTDFSPDASAALDLTPLYRDHATSVRRKAGLLADGRIAFEDNWTAGPAPVEVTWQFLTHADITVEPRGVLLRQAGETLRIRVLSPEAITIQIDDLSQPPRPSDAPSPGLRRIRILVRTPAGQPGRIVIHAETGSFTTAQP